MPPPTPTQTWLTGITTSGTPHLGNYVGAIRPAVEASRDPTRNGFYFLADYHSLIKQHDPRTAAGGGRFTGGVCYAAAVRPARRARQDRTAMPAPPWNRSPAAPC